MRKITNIMYLAFALFAFACFTFLPAPKAFGVVPPPDGGYPGFNTAEGTNALKNLTTGVGNTATGWHSLFANTTGNLNTAVGAGTLLLNAGDNNTATGALALLNNTNGFYNTADGAWSLFSNTEGSGNTASGYQALYANETGANNAAYGFTALYNNTGSFNTALGSQTLVFNTTGNQNTATGYQALAFNTIGESNTASGYYSLRSNTQGFANTAFGMYALLGNTTGSSNIALGYAAGEALTMGNSNIYIGNNGANTENGAIRIGSNGTHTSTYIGGIAGQTVGAGGTACYVDNDGKLGVFLSARRYKQDIRAMDEASTGLLALKPVTFRYKPECGNEGIPQFGLVAEEVAEVNPDLVTRDDKGQIVTVRYEAVNAMLLNEFLKEHREVQELKKQVAALTAGLQKVRAQVEMNRTGSQIAVNNQ